MSKITNIIIRCVVCINLYIISNRTAKEIAKTDDAEFVAFEQIVESATYYAIRS